MRHIGQQHHHLVDFLTFLIQLGLHLFFLCLQLGGLGLHLFGLFAAAFLEHLADGLGNLALLHQVVVEVFLQLSQLGVKGEDIVDQLGGVEIFDFQSFNDVFWIFA